MNVILSKKDKDEMVIDYLDGLIAAGKRRSEAIIATCKKFNIVHPQTVYNTEARIRKRQWEVRHGKREA